MNRRTFIGSLLAAPSAFIWIPGTGMALEAGSLPDMSAAAAAAQFDWITNEIIQPAHDRILNDFRRQRIIKLSIP